MHKSIEDVKQEFNVDVLVRGNKFYFTFQTMNYLLFAVNLIYLYGNNVMGYKTVLPYFIIETIAVTFHLICCLCSKWKSMVIPYIVSIFILIVEGVIINYNKDPDILTNIICNIAITIVFFDIKFTLFTGISSIIMLLAMMFINQHNFSYVNLFVTIIKYYFTFFMSALLTVSFSIFAKRIKQSMLNERIDEYMMSKIKQDNDFAKKIQSGFLKQEFPSNEIYDINACMIPSKEVGGDFYDFYVIDKSRIVLLVADVSGKGIPASLFMANAKTVIKDCIVYGISFEKSIETANREMMRENKEMQFITIFICVIDLITGKMNYINAGHVKPLVMSKDGNVSIINSKPDFIFGVRKDTRYHSNEYMLKPGDRLFMCTDGVTERLNVNNKLYGKEKLIETLSKNSKKETQDIISSVLKSLDNYGAGKEQNDDITCLLFNYKKNLVLEPDIVRDFEISKDRTADIILYISQVLKSKEVPDKIINLVAVASDEIISNVVKYAYDGMDNEKKLNIDIQVYNRVIKISYIDYGKYFDPLSKITLSGTTKVTDKSKIGGLGIQLTWNIMDEVLYNRIDDKNVIQIIKEY